MRALAALPQDWNWLPSTQVRRLTAAPASGDPVPISGLHRHLHTHAYTLSHTHVHINKNKSSKFSPECS